MNSLSSSMNNYKLAGLIQKLIYLIYALHQKPTSGFSHQLEVLMLMKYIVGFSSAVEFGEHPTATSSCIIFYANANKSAIWDINFCFRVIYCYSQHKNAVLTNRNDKIR